MANPVRRARFDLQPSDDLLWRPTAFQSANHFIAQILILFQFTTFQMATIRESLRRQMSVPISLRNPASLQAVFDGGFQIRVNDHLAMDRAALLIFVPSDERVIPV